jgi:hypothetical protein
MTTIAILGRSFFVGFDNFPNNPENLMKVYKKSTNYTVYQCLVIYIYIYISSSDKYLKNFCWEQKVTLIII